MEKEMETLTHGDCQKLIPPPANLPRWPSVITAARTSFEPGTATRWERGEPSLPGWVSGRAKTALRSCEENRLTDTSPWPNSCLQENPTCCCSTNRQTISTWEPATGWKTFPELLSLCLSADLARPLLPGRDRGPDRRDMEPEVAVLLRQLQQLLDQKQQQREQLEAAYRNQKERAGSTRRPSSTASAISDQNGAEPDQGTGAHGAHPRSPEEKVMSLLLLAGGIRTHGGRGGSGVEILWRC